MFLLPPELLPGVPHFFFTLFGVPFTVAYPNLVVWIVLAVVFVGEHDPDDKVGICHGERDTEEREEEVGDSRQQLGRQQEHSSSSGRVSSAHTLAERPVDPPFSRGENGCGRAVRSPRRSARADRNGAVNGSV